MRPWAVFLDRDGVLNEHVGYLREPRQLRLLPGAAEGLRVLREAGALLVVVTNQSVVARGLVSEEGLARIHARLAELLDGEGARLDGLLYCPHHPEPGPGRPGTRCGCRKPEPGLLLEAARRWGIDLARSYLVGDSTSDVEAARRAGLRAVLVRTGLGGADARHPEARPAAVAADLRAAAAWILRAPPERSLPGENPI